jgi:hypothetical protein
VSLVWEDGRGGSGDEGAGAGTRDCRVRSRLLVDIKLP